MTEDGTTRRGFLRRAAGAAAGLAGAMLLGGSCAEGGQGLKKSAAKAVSSDRNGAPVVVVARDRAVWKGDELDRRRVRELLMRAVKKYTGAGSDEEAWRSLFEGAGSAAMKLNCIAGRRLSSTPEVAAAIAGGLKLAGLREGKIIAWDRYNRELRNAGFSVGGGEDGMICMGTDSPEAGYDNELTIAGEVGSMVSGIATRLCGALVNVPVLKDHDLAGVSGALKNWFGAIHNPNKLHENGCDPYVADLNTMPVFRDKTRLIVCDATLAQYHGGPGYKPEYAWKFAGLVVGGDPVAVDTVLWRLIEKKRAEKGLPTLEEDERPPKYIASAAHPSRALGENRMEKIRMIEI